jgi:hypothetical protein
MARRKRYDAGMRAHQPRWRADVPADSNDRWLQRHHPRPTAIADLNRRTRTDPADLHVVIAMRLLPHRLWSFPHAAPLSRSGCWRRHRPPAWRLSNADLATDHPGDLHVAIAPRDLANLINVHAVRTRLTDQLLKLGRKLASAAT